MDLIWPRVFRRSNVGLVIYDSDDLFTQIFQTLFAGAVV